MFSSPPTQYPNHIVRRVSLACPAVKYPSCAQSPSIPTVLTMPNAAYPGSAQPQSLPAVPNCRASMQCSKTEAPSIAHPTAEYPCSAQSQNAPAMQKVPAEYPAAPKLRANADYHCTAQPLSIPVAPQSLPCPTPESYSQLLNPRTSIPHSPKACLERPTEECPCSARPRTILAMPKILQRFLAVCNSRKPSHYPHGSSRNVQLSCLQVIDDAGKLQK